MAKVAARVSTQALKSMGVAPEQVQLFKGPLQEACALFQIDSPARVAAFLAQTIFERPGLKACTEADLEADAQAWSDRGCNGLADARQFSAITHLIVGASMRGHDARMTLYTQAINALD